MGCSLLPGRLLDDLASQYVPEAGLAGIHVEYLTDRLGNEVGAGVAAVRTDCGLLTQGEVVLGVVVLVLSSC